MCAAVFVCVPHCTSSLLFPLHTVGTYSHLCLWLSPLYWYGDIKSIKAEITKLHSFTLHLISNEIFLPHVFHLSGLISISQKGRLTDMDLFCLLSIWITHQPSAALLNALLASQPARWLDLLLPSPSWFLLYVSIDTFSCLLSRRAARSRCHVSTCHHLMKLSVANNSKAVSINTAKQAQINHFNYKNGIMKANGSTQGPWLITVLIIKFMIINQHQVLRMFWLYFMIRDLTGKKLTFFSLSYILIDNSIMYIFLHPFLMS